MYRRRLVALSGVTVSSFAGCLSSFDDPMELRLTNSAKDEWEADITVESRDGETLYTGDFTVEHGRQDGDEFSGNPLTVRVTTADGREEEFRVDPKSDFLHCDYDDLSGIHVIQLSDGEIILRHFC